ncbi:hypothetical protein FPOAC2_10610 [Fusarium poae]
MHLKKVNANLKHSKALLEDSQVDLEDIKGLLDAALKSNKAALNANKIALEANKAALEGCDTTILEAAGGSTVATKTEKNDSANEEVALVPGKKRKAEAEAGECMTCKGQSCVLCKNKGHTMEHCLLLETGSIYGCVLCNKTSHDTDKCAKFTSLKMEEKLNILINERGGLPPLRTQQGWHYLMLTWLHDKESKGKKAPSMYPWTGMHAFKLSRGVDGGRNYYLQSRFDRSGHDRSILPKDESLKDAVAVWRYYWRPASIPFPQRLVEMGFSRPHDDIRRIF